MEYFLCRLSTIDFDWTSAGQVKAQSRFMGIPSFAYDFKFRLSQILIDVWLVAIVLLYTALIAGQLMRRLLKLSIFEFRVSLYSEAFCDPSPCMYHELVGVTLLTFIMPDV